MTVLAQDRDTERRVLGRRIVIPVLADEIIYSGALVTVLTTDGFARAGTSAATGVVIGRAAKQIDATGDTSGDQSVVVEKGVFKWANSAGNAVDQGDVGSSVVIEDDQTVATTAGSNIAAGIVDEIDADGGIWVATL